VLRQHLVQEVEDLIQQQRFNFMVEGTKFPRYKRSGDLLKGQYCYVKLHTNHKVGLFNFMVEGTKFPRYKRSGDLLKGQYCYVKLHTYHKVGLFNSMV
jgi:hypothetical protein